MNDNKVDYDQLIKERISIALKNQHSEEKLDLNTLKEWVEQDRINRKLKNRIIRFLKFRA